MTGAVCGSSIGGIESMSTKDLMWLERATVFCDGETAIAAHAELCKRRESYVKNG